MRHIAFVITLLTLSCTIARAQQEYFLFIWADNQQPFYVRLDEKTHSSSAIGHLVIPRLKDSTYDITIGFPKKQYPEQSFTVPFNNKDLDFQLKYTAGERWVLVNAQTAETIKPRQDHLAKNNTPPLGERKTGAFATLMSGLVNDSAVMYKSLTKTHIPLKPAAPEAKKDTAIAASIPPAADATAPTGSVKNDSLNKSASAITVNPANTVKDTSVGALGPDSLTLAIRNTTPSVVIQVQEWWNDKGKGFIYYDSSAIGIDTISLIIDFDKNAGLPTPEQVIAAPAKMEAVKTAILPPDTAITKKQESLSKDSLEKATTRITTDTAARSAAARAATTTTDPLPTKEAAEKSVVATRPDSVVTVTTKADSGATNKDSATAQEAVAKKSLLLMNSDCTNFASEYDVDKLRVKMLNAANTDDRIAVAKKVFKTKCFVTRYIRGLSELFPNDEDRFKFFDAAYPFVSDSGNFRTLLDLFTNELYIARFKALVRM